MRRFIMCKKCDKYKQEHQEYNYCPICGDKLKSVAFVPDYEIRRKNGNYKQVYFDANKIR